MSWKFYNPKFEYEQLYIDLGGPWSGHKYFTYDLIINLPPKKIVELGTHLGCSLFSFSQAIKDSRLNTTIDAIDTWEGDNHSGSYGDIILSKVNEIKDKKYHKIKINLIRKTFDEAVENYQNNSIDLLHIDGLHTYKAVRHDFETWFDKVNNDGIILFHDISVKTWGFGIYKLWAELKKEYKTIEFNHSYGLGILFKNPDMYSKISNYEQAFSVYYPTVAEKELYKWQLQEDQKRINQLESAVNKIKSTKAYKLYQLLKKLKRS